MAVKFIPEGYHTVTPSLVVKGAGKLIEFLNQAFGAEEAMRMPAPNGEIIHAEVKIGDSLVMLADAMGPSPTITAASLFLYLPDVDAAYRKAIKAGATTVAEPADMFWGDRVAQVRDPSGTHWAIATHKEDVSPAELEKRAAAMNR